MADRLTIRAIETIPIRVPLTRTYQGSSYRMTHRSTIVTRIHTDEGVTGEAYAGDEDSDLLEIDRIINQEIAPRLIGEDALAVERCWELARPVTFDILRDRRRGPRRLRLRRHGNLGCGRQSLSGSLSGVSGEVIARSSR